MSFPIEKIDIRSFGSFEDFFREYYPVVCSLADRYLHDPAMAEDVAQDAFERLWNKRYEYGNIVSLKAYLFTMTRNLCLNAIRDDPRRRSIAVSMWGGGEDGLEPVIIELETIRLLNAAIQKLPTQSRKIMELTVKGYGNKHIAEQLGISVNSVKTLKYNAMAKLRGDLSGKIGEPYVFALLLRIMVAEHPGLFS